MKVDLPLLVVENILGWIQIDDDHASTKAALIELRSVCKFWNSSIIPVLFRYTTFPSASDIARFLQAATPETLHALRGIWFEGDVCSQEFQTLLETCSDSLHFLNCYFDELCDDEPAPDYFLQKMLRCRQSLTSFPFDAFWAITDEDQRNMLVNVDLGYYDSVKSLIMDASHLEVLDQNELSIILKALASLESVNVVFKYNSNLFTTFITHLSPTVKRINITVSIHEQTPQTIAPFNNTHTLQLHVAGCEENDPRRYDFLRSLLRLFPNCKRIEISDSLQSNLVASFDATCALITRSMCPNLTDFVSKTVVVTHDDDAESSRNISLPTFQDFFKDLTCFAPWNLQVYRQSLQGFPDDWWGRLLEYQDPQPHHSPNNHDLVEKEELGRFLTVLSRMKSVRKLRIQRCFDLTGLISVVNCINRYCSEVCELEFHQHGMDMTMATLEVCVLQRLVAKKLWVLKLVHVDTMTSSERQVRYFKNDDTLEVLSYKSQKPGLRTLRVM